MSGAASPSNSPPNSGARSRRARASADNAADDPLLFDGLSRALSDAEIDRRRVERERRTAAGGGGGGESSGATSDDETVASGRRSPLTASSSNLDTTLIDAARAQAASDAYAYRRAPPSILRRHIRLVDGEFSIPLHERNFVLSQRGCFTRLMDWLFRRTPIVDRKELFIDNRVTSSRYEWYTFLPKNLTEQLMPHNKPANFYFLIIACLQSIKEISTTSGRPSILLPLTFVLTVTAIKDGLEDQERHKQDEKKNGAKYWVYKQRRWTLIDSRDLQVGDLVRIKEGQRIPADILLVSSGIANGATAFVDTKELDGETSLKPKQVPPSCFSSFPRSWRHPHILSIDLRTDLPNQSMNSWSGDIVVNRVRENVNMSNMLLTDSVLRNTNWAMGMVVYSGEDTKIRQNMRRQMMNTKQKQSTMFKLTNKLFIGMVFMQVIIVFTAAIVSGMDQAYNLSHGAWYLQSVDPPIIFALLRFLTWLIIVKDFIPISLYVSLELVQYAQGIFIRWDLGMSSVVNGEYQPATAQTSKLNEELSQVEYIFTDKTGTLTKNSMVFRKCIIGQQLYGTGTTEAGVLRKKVMERLARKHAGLDDDDASHPPASSHPPPPAHRVALSVVIPNENDIKSPHVEFNEFTRIAASIVGLPPLSSRLSALSLSAPNQRELVQVFLYALALNNSVFPKSALRSKIEEEDDEHEEGDVRLDVGGLPRTRAPIVEDGSQCIILEASSPDERSLVSFSQLLGFELVKRSGGQAQLRMMRAASVDQLMDEVRSVADAESMDATSVISSSPRRTLAKVPGSFAIETFHELCILDFTAKRKRMTAILRPIVDGVPSNEVLILIKGADSSLRPLMSSISPELWATTFAQLSEFGSESLRTLLFSYAIKPFSWWEGSDIAKAYTAAIHHPGDSEKGHVEGACSDDCSICDTETAIEKAAGFVLLGATAIEDKLQDDVPKTLQKLSDGGIKIWLCTGDNLSTGTNIAIACNLLDADMSNTNRLFSFDRDLDTPQLIDQYLERCIRRVDQLFDQYIKSEAEAPPSSSPAPSPSPSPSSSPMGSDEPEVYATPTVRRPQLPTFGLCFHGDVFKILIDDHVHQQAPIDADSSSEPPSPSHQSSSSSSSYRPPMIVGSLLDRFFSFASRCKSVIACRLEPKEKAEIVAFMAKRTGKVCLAIGDGNNDTPMIREASIGVGIRGVEGTSAAASSDYAISEFKFLARLLLVHGRLNARRISILICFVFYKSAILVFTSFLFGMFSQFSGTFLYLDWMIQLHNVFFTASPILVFAILDRDLSIATLERHPHIYSLTRGPVLLNVWIFAQWIAVAIAQATVCFSIPFLTIEDGPPAADGQLYGVWSTGLCVYICLILTINFRLLFVYRSWTIFHHVCLWGSILAFMGTTVMFCSTTTFAIGGVDYYMIIFNLVALGKFWLVIALTVWINTAIDMTHHHMVLHYNPSATHRLVVAERLCELEGGGEAGGERVKQVAKELYREHQREEQELVLKEYASSSKYGSNGVNGASASNKDKGSNGAFVHQTAEPISSSSSGPRPSPSPSPPSAYTGSNFSFTPRIVHESGHASPVESRSPPNGAATRDTHDRNGFSRVDV